MAGYRAKDYTERTEKMLRHKARVLWTNHWTIDEIAAELRLSIPTVYALLNGKSTSETIYDLV